MEANRPSPRPPVEPAVEPAAECGGSWRAELALAFEARAGRTVLARRRHYGPLMVQRPFYPEGGVCHVYPIHPPGGIVGGDRLRIDVDCAPGSHALITTPAATKFYRSAGPVARQEQYLRIAPGAALEWLPQESIVFDGAEARNRTVVDIAPGGRFLGWEIVCLGLPASGQYFERGRLVQHLEVFQEERPLLVERVDLAGGSPVLRAPWGLGGSTVTATMIVVPPQPGMAEAVREAWAPPAPGDWAAVTEMEGALVLRCLADGAVRAKARLEAAWRVLRPLWAGRPASPPRIWNT